MRAKITVPGTHKLRIPGTQNVATIQSQPFYEVVSRTRRKKSEVIRAVFSQVNCAARSRPDWMAAARACESRTMASMPAAKATASSCLAIGQTPPETSGRQDESETTPGMPTAMASSSGSANPSYREGWSRQEAAARSPGRSAPETFSTQKIESWTPCDNASSFSVSMYSGLAPPPTNARACLRSGHVK